MATIPSRRNLIVTCGTSQILKKFHGVDFQARGMNRNLESFLRILSDYSQGALPTISDLDDPEIEQGSDHISRIVLEHWDRRHEHKQNSAIFGAEISTLAGMEQKNGEFYWNPQTDHLTLIATQTMAGIFSASVVKKIIHAGWDVPEHKIAMRMVEDLNENPEKIDQAMYNLAYHIGESLKESTSVDPWENIFVASGGFKSFMPCLTIYSFLFGIKLIYTFELSDVLQALHPRFNEDNEEARRFWQNTWKAMTRQKWMNTSTSIYLQYILQYRKDRPLAIF